LAETLTLSDQNPTLSFCGQIKKFDKYLVYSGASLSLWRYFEGETIIIVFDCFMFYSSCGDVLVKGTSLRGGHEHRAHLARSGGGGIVNIIFGIIIIYNTYSHFEKIFVLILFSICCFIFFIENNLKTVRL